MIVNKLSMTDSHYAAEFLISYQFLKGHRNVKK